MTQRLHEPRPATTALRGVAYLAAGTVLVRAASLLAQLALGKLLLKDDFGLYALTVTVWTFVQLLTNPGLDDVLIARKARIHLWAPQAVWISLLLGVLGTLAMLAAAPIAARAYADPSVGPLVLITAMAAIPSALSLVPAALIRARLRFRLWAGYLAASQILLFALQVSLAYAGFGARAFVIPIPIVAALGMVFLWFAAPPPMRAAPQVRRWRHLVGDGVPLLGVRVVQTLQGNADRMVLGVVAATGVVGVYYFAFQIATQVSRVLAANLNQALFPGLAGLRDQPERQLAGTLAASRLVGLVGVPAGCLQAACIGPLLRLMFGGKWDAAILPAQIMSIAVGIDCMAWAGASLMQAQRRFRLMLAMQIGACAALLAMLAVASLLAHDGTQAVAIAGATAAYLAVVPALAFGIAIRAAGGRWTDLGGVYAPPVLLSIPAGLAAFAAAAWVPGAGPATEALRIVAALGVGGATYLVLALALARPLLIELFSRLRDAAARR